MNKFRLFIDAELFCIKKEESCSPFLYYKSQNKCPIEIVLYHHFYISQLLSILQCYIDINNFRKVGNVKICQTS